MPKITSNENLLIIQKQSIILDTFGLKIIIQLNCNVVNHNTTIFFVQNVFIV